MFVLFKLLNRLLLSKPLSCYFRVMSSNNFIKIMFNFDFFGHENASAKSIHSNSFAFFLQFVFLQNKKRHSLTVTIEFNLKLSPHGGTHLFYTLKLIILLLSIIMHVSVIQNVSCSHHKTKKNKNKYHSSTFYSTCRKP